MCEFKIGDVVRRIISDNNPAAKIGTIATVVALYNNHNIPIMDVVYEGKDGPEMWCQDKAELVERRPPYAFKVAHKFAVGDKGKTKAGSSYVIVAEHNDKFICHYTSKIGNDLDYASVRRDGMCYDGSSKWLLPPAKTVWRVELTGVKGPGTSGLLDMTSTRYYDTEENARKGIARGINNYITVKGPFPEECDV